MEDFFKRGQESIEMLIAGASYVIDFKRLIQFPKHRPGRIRKIKRSDTPLPKLGVAGIRFSQ